MQPDPFPRLTEAQLEQMRRDQREWQSVPPPCGIPHIDIWNPCLPERDERGLWCATCMLRQRLAITAGDRRWRLIQSRGTPHAGGWLDGLGAIGSDVARISFTTPTRPAVLTGKDDGDGYRYVLMPIRSAG